MLAEDDSTRYSVESVARELGITARTLRYYEELGLITPASRTPGGHRQYDQQAIDRLKNVIRLKNNVGFSLQEIREVLDAERSLELLKHDFRQGEHDDDSRARLLDSYIEVLRRLVEKLDSKIENLNAMRRTYHERLERSIRFRSENQHE